MPYTATTSMLIINEYVYHINNWDVRYTFKNKSSNFKTLLKLKETIR